ncbi:MULTISPECIES: AI-2E family transporter [unclassified Achromobacter]|uniref:AI-2E family transporter n=1 Tax=unclassified Achromobacter TaxID=2626865 RepID=UPI000B51683A|nr:MULTISPECIES: AI-2E family transporter [unclassified Achromobacter]OWT80326.1 AI-2E family transporter [Achromobacter sp. HZ34]OWT82209.1 AI-2E family transporter [Achromobacter sp. HZ28]
MKPASELPEGGAAGRQPALPRRAAPVGPPPSNLALGLIAALMFLALLYFASSIFVPLAFALFILALVAPLQRVLRPRLGSALASIVTLLISLCVLMLFLYLAAWGFNLVAQWTMGNAARLQRLFTIEVAELHPHLALVQDVFLDNFNVYWLLRAIQEVLLRVNSLAGQIFLAFLFLTLGVFELDDAPGRLRRMLPRAEHWIAVAADVARKLRRYMLIRSIASVLTGITVWLFAMYAGLELATAWGGLAFLLNYIPFLGPLLATLFPTFFAFVQFESLRTTVFVFVILNVIQVGYGCYLEPRLAGSAFSLSPLMVMVAVFFGGWIWGIPGTFIGVPMLIVATSVWSANQQARRDPP